MTFWPPRFVETLVETRSSNNLLDLVGEILRQKLSKHKNSNQRSKETHQKEQSPNLGS